MVWKLAVTSVFMFAFAPYVIAQDSRSDLFSKQPGRYQIVMHPTFRADQYLLDTATGQVWQLTKFSNLKGEPEAWKSMTRLDNDADYFAWLLSKPSKTASETNIDPAPTQKLKPSGSPLKLN
jgi:hypothetical protein